MPVLFLCGQCHFDSRTDTEHVNDCPGWRVSYRLNLSMKQTGLIHLEMLVVLGDGLILWFLNLNFFFFYLFQVASQVSVESTVKFKSSVH